MDLVDRIETTRFVGSEFLTWLWFRSELFDGRFSFGALGAGELWLQAQLTLVDAHEPTEKVMLRGAQPSASQEAAEALRQGKIPLKATLRLTLLEQEFIFTFDAQRFAMSGVKLPALLSQEDEEKLFERLQLIEDLGEILDLLYGEFLQLRLAPAWDATIVPELRRWVNGQPVFAPTEYEAVLAACAKS